MVAGAAAGRTVTISPHDAAPGSAATISGTGFTGECDVLLSWGSADGDILGAARIAGDGTFRTTVEVPPSARPGAATVLAQGRAFGITGCGDLSGTAAAGSLSVVGDPVPLYDRRIPMLRRVLNDPGVDSALISAINASVRPTHAIVQLQALPTATDLVTLMELGVLPLQYLNGIDRPGTAYLASVRPGISADDPRFKTMVRSVQALQPDDKIDASLLALAADACGELPCIEPAPTAEAVIQFFGDVPEAAAAAVLASHGIVGDRNGSMSTYRATLTGAHVDRLAAEDTVQFLMARPKVGQLDVDRARTLGNVDVLQRFDVGSATYLGLSGYGVQMSIHDSGVDEHHGDFANRMLRELHPDADGDHGTHVASIAVGSGVMSNQNNDANMSNGGTAFQYRGMAPQTKIAAYDSQTGDDADVMDEAINTHGVDVSNHSYSYNDAQYDSTMVDIDTIIRGDNDDIPARPQIFSAGNQGDGKQWGENSGYFSLTKSCKNCLMVANLDNTGVLNGGSSHGPTPDGRLKPDLGAMGTSVLAAGADVHNGRGGSSTGNSYRTKNGTSMSTPMVSGIVSLLLQQWAAQYGVNLDDAPPLPSTVKAILLQTAVDQAGTGSSTNPDTEAATQYGAGPDWATGYGLVDAQAASQLMAARRFVENAVSATDVTDEHLVGVVPGQDELKVTLAWDDVAGTPNANHASPALVNDLDLLLVGPNGEVVRPLVLPRATQFDCDSDASNGTQTGCANPGDDPGPFDGTAAEGTDRLNNVEQVLVANPAPGLWRARVSVLNVDTTVRLPLGGDQRYSIAGVTESRADIAVAITDTADPAVAGERLSYAVSLTNDGASDATNVVAVAQLPDGATFLASDLVGGCTVAPAGRLDCAAGDIAAGATKTFRIYVQLDPSMVVNAANGTTSIFTTVTVFSNTPDSDPADNVDVEGTIVGDRADLSVNKLCEPNRPLNAGESGQCTIFVDNHGPSDARAVKITETLLSDTAISLADATPSAGTCDAVANVAGGKKLVCTIGTLAAASASTPGRATLTYTMSSSDGGDIDVTTTASSLTADPNTADNRATDTISVVSVADLALAWASSPASAVAGETSTYALTLTNTGPSAADNVVLDDIAPAGTSIVSVTGSGGDSSCQAGVPGVETRPSRCTFGTLANGASRTVTVVAKVDPSTTGLLHNDARASSATFDPNNANDLATANVAVNQIADLSMVTSSTPNPVVAGTPLDYRIEIRSAGPSLARDVLLTDVLPAEVVFRNATINNSTGECDTLEGSARTVECELADLGPGGHVTVILHTVVKSSTPAGSLSHTPAVTSLAADPVAANNASTITTAVETAADLVVTNTSDADVYKPSSTIAYTITVRNDGPSDAQAVVLTYKMPPPKDGDYVFDTGGCSVSADSTTLTCTIGTLANGASRTINVYWRVKGSKGVLTSVATVVSTTTDPATSNNTSTRAVLLKGGV